jgi:hypothetical protein
MHDPILPFIIASITFALFAAWITHVAWWLALVFRRRISRSNFFWGLAGILIPILGMLHGLAIWFRVEGAKEKT